MDTFTNQSGNPDNPSRFAEDENEIVFTQEWLDDYPVYTHEWSGSQENSESPRAPEDYPLYGSSNLKETPSGCSCLIQ